MQQNIVLYETNEGDISVNVVLKEETLWLSLKQITDLFERDKSVISKHLKNIFQEQELDESSVVAKFATTASDGKVYQVDHYNLDAILSVGYRVNSKRGTQFRKWASSVLRDYIVEGYSLNQRVIRENTLKTQSIIDLLSRTLTHHTLIDDLGIQLLHIVRSYAKTWDVLLRYDEDRLTSSSDSDACLTSLSYQDSVAAIETLKKELILQNSMLFGQERGDGLKAILGSLDQTFNGVSLYSSVEEKAAHLLYFVIKDHPFSDGNKRIGCLLFLIYLQKSGKNISSINDNALIALALLIAESQPSQKNITIELINSLLKDN